MNSTSPLWKLAGFVILFVFLVSVACAGFSSSQETDTLARTQTSLASTSDALQTAASQPKATKPLTPEQPIQTQPVSEAQSEKTEPPLSPAGPTISSSVNTNCREGPSPDYKVLGYLLSNQTSEVHGRDSSKNWWYIINPEKPNNFCWVWKETTTVTGDTSNLPIITPPPPPAPPEVSFTASFSGVNMCSGNPLLVFGVSNSSEVELESAKMKIEDITESETVFGPAKDNTPFMTAGSGCNPNEDTLAPGGAGFVGGKVTRLSLPGATIQAVITLCSENDLNGVCAQQTLEFVMPVP